jgi:hypothetical protein
MQLNSEQIRSFLASNIEVILENLSARRESKKNNSEDIFANLDSTSKIIWKKQYSQLSQMQTLVQEKNSLGVYMSGNPLSQLKNILSYFQTITDEKENLQLAILEKTKKIFTKSNALMYALQLTLVDQEIEGVIFSKKAMKYSNLLTDGQLYWILGRIDDPEKRKSRKAKNLEQTIEEDLSAQNFEEDSNEASETSDDIEPVSEVIQEYAEKPKFLISHISAFDLGLAELFVTDEETENKDFTKYLKDYNWSEILTNPDGFTLDTSPTPLRTKSEKKNYYSRKKTSSDKIVVKPSTSQEIITIELPFSLGHKIKQIKENLKKEPFPAGQKVEIKIENSNGEWQKVKGFFWLDISKINPN